VQLLSNVSLADGRNDFQASINGPGGESQQSAVATYILDTTRPKVQVISPKNGASVKGNSVTIKGKSQANSSIRLQNSSNGATMTVNAGKDGLWQTAIGLGGGTNLIEITATDPAGNTNTAELSVVRGTAKMVATLSASTYRFRASKLPTKLTLTVSVLGSDGKALGGATALFTISVPGLEAIVSGQITTKADGTASFSTMIPSGATPGSGLATVLVSASGETNATDRQVLTIVK
jgi:hypothetical protein